MTISETITIQASTPPSDLPHDTASAEVARLPDYLSGTVQRDDGTDYVVTSAAYKDAAGNAGRVYIALDADTNEILAIQSKVGGVWTNWMIGADSIADSAITPAKLAEAVAGAGLTRNSSSSALDVNVDGATLEVTGDKLQVKPSGIGSAQLGSGSVISDKIPTGVSLTEPRIVNQVCFNEGEVHAFHIGSNSDEVTGYKHCWIGSWEGGVPLDIYIVTDDDHVTIHKFSEDERSMSVPGGFLKESLDSAGNVYHETTSGTAQNVVWKNSRYGAAYAMQLEASEGKLLIRKLNISGLPTSSSGLSAGDVWNDGGTLRVV